MNKYDYIIIGAGPTGLTLAFLLSKYNMKVAIIEKDSNIGGCHGVTRINSLFSESSEGRKPFLLKSKYPSTSRGAFSEHGPRIYIDNYLMFKKILSEMNTSWDDLFVPYKFGRGEFLNSVFPILSTRELFHLIWAFLTLNDSYKKISLLEFTQKYNFSEKSINLLDNLGRITDGGSIEQYTLYNFLQIINQNFLYKIYQPRLPNDIGLFKIWENILVSRKVDIFKNSTISDIDHYNNKIISVTFNNRTLYGTNFIFAMPPYSINELLKNTSLKDVFSDRFDKWSKLTNYITYIPITFHWQNKIKLNPIWGFPQTSWGIAHIVLSDYMNFNNCNSKTVIIAAITKHNKSNYINKSPHEISDKNTIIKEVIRQLRLLHNNLPDPDYAIMDQNYYDGNKWISKHTAFMTTKYGHIDFESKYNNLYNCGVQNGHSFYSFTSLEASVQNAVSLVHKLIPQSRNEYKIPSILTVRQILFV